MEGPCSRGLGVPASAGRNGSAWGRKLWRACPPSRRQLAGALTNLEVRSPTASAPPNFREGEELLREGSAPPRVEAQVAKSQAGAALLALALAACGDSAKSGTGCRRRARSVRPSATTVESPSKASPGV